MFLSKMVFLVFSLFFSSLFKVLAQELPKDRVFLDFNVITSNAKKHIDYLTSYKLLGRSTLTGHDLFASNYIDSIFRSFELKANHSDTPQHHFQDFLVIQTTPLHRTLSIPGAVFDYGIDFINLGSNPKSGIEFEVVFGGSGELEHLDSLDLKGKALLILSTNLRVAGMKVQELANRKGCSLVIITNPINPKQFFTINRQLIDAHSSPRYRISDVKPKPLSRFLSRFDEPIPQILVSDNVATLLLGDKPARVWDRIQKGVCTKRIPKDIKISFNYEFLVDTLPTSNVIGWIPAGGNTQQSVVVCAHFDHLAPQGQIWFPGADDNASGTAVIIELARLLSEDVKNGYKPKRNIVFAGFSAEEIGLLGSEYFSLNPPFQADSTVIMLNLDMAGRMGKQEQGLGSLYIGGSNRLIDISHILQTLKTDTTFVIDPESLASISLFTLSDHYHYDKKGIPAYLVTTGMHSDYHKPTDTTNKVSYESIQRVTSLMYKAIRHFADKKDPWAL
jgi:hypothetical protein